MKLLAIDVSTVVLGYAVGDHTWPLTDVTIGSLDLGNMTPARKPRWLLHRRLQELVKVTDRLLDDLKPEMLAIECPDVSGRHHHRSGSHHTDLTLGLAVGGVLALANQRRLTVALWDARLVRDRLLGNGNRPKDAVQWYLQHIHALVMPLRTNNGAEEVDDDACDAAALWVAQSDELRATAGKLVARA